MFPPVEEHVLRNNPDFAKLLSSLTTTALNPDGSTKNNPEVKELGNLNSNLEKLRLRTAKHHVLERAIATAALSDPKPLAAAKPPRAAERPQNRRQQEIASPSDLPEPLLDLLLLLPPLFDVADTLPHDSLALLLTTPPLSELESLLPDLADVVSANLHASALGLARITHPSTNPSFLHRHIASLRQDLADLNAKLSAAEQDLNAARLRVVATLTELLQIYSDCIVCLIRSLEAKHGVIARNLELHATDVSLQAQLAEKQTEQAMLKLRKGIYTPDVVSALQNYALHLRDARNRGAEKIRGLEAELDSYGVGSTGEGDEGRRNSIRELAKSYREIGEQIEDANRDLGRLQT